MPCRSFLHCTLPCVLCALYDTRHTPSDDEARSGTTRFEAAVPHSRVCDRPPRSRPAFRHVAEAGEQCRAQLDRAGVVALTRETVRGGGDELHHAVPPAAAAIARWVPGTRGRRPRRRPRSSGRRSGNPRARLRGAQAARHARHVAVQSVARATSEIIRPLPAAPS